jgi:hypothetical protein
MLATSTHDSAQRLVDVRTRGACPCRSPYPVCTIVAAITWFVSLVDAQTVCIGASAGRLRPPC